MLTIIKNLFSSREKLMSSNVEFVVTKITSGKMYDDAVQEVILREQRRLVKMQIIKIVMGAEKYDQALLANKYLAENVNAMSNGNALKTKAKFPLVEIVGIDWTTQADMRFDIDAFVEALVTE